MTRFELKTRAALFDLDGVLMDSRECVERTWRDWAHRHGFDEDRVVHVAHGRRTIETVAQVAPHLVASDEVAALAESEAQESRGVYPIPGVNAVLRALPATRWAIVTIRVMRETS
jgi:mannitol-1-/sugar-/sorbitol-6-phosphatase